MGYPYPYVLLLCATSDTRLEHTYTAAKVPLKLTSFGTSLNRGAAKRWSARGHCVPFSEALMTVLGARELGSTVDGQKSCITHNKEYTIIPIV